MEKRVCLSVRQLVEFVLRRGSIDSGYLGMKRAQEGTRIHQQLQRKRKKEAELQDFSYEKEVFLTLDFPYKDFLFHLEGRADSLIMESPQVAVLEEIKSTSKDLSLIEQDLNHWHWAQAKCYGYMYCRLKNLDSIQILLTYCHIETHETLEFKHSFPGKELEDFFCNIAEKYYSFAKMDYERISLRIATALALPFPYDSYRKSQREFAASVYRTIQRRKNLFAQAPTGTGKTISVLFPAIKGLQEGKIFYLTAKTITRQAAEDALALMSQKGLRLVSITLTAKDKLCFCGERPLNEGGCNPVSCSYANGHFDRVNDAIIDIISNETLINRQIVEAYARKHRVCPFEFSLDASLFCDCIVCDYNHAYDPKIQLKRFFGEDCSNHIILVDEAHNLVERSRDMFSAELRRESFASTGRLLRKTAPALYKAIGKIKKWFPSTKGSTVLQELPQDLPPLLRDFTTKADQWLAEHSGREAYPELLNLYFSVLDFLRISELYDDSHVFYIEQQGKDISVKLLCLDPSRLLAQSHKKMRSTIFFSATLNPLNYFINVLGGDSSFYGLRIPSPFPRENLCLLVDNSISIKYKDRQNNASLAAERIFAMTSAKKGNYFAFFSSYAYLNTVLDIFSKEYPHVRLLVQTPGMTEEHKEEFLKSFSACNRETLIGFVVLGGIFSEGIDLAGNRLIGSAIIGVGLPMITEERDLISDYYQRKLGNGFTYAYVYPGMNKVMQAAGRVIRHHEDKGVVFLIDSRFLNYTYEGLFPEEWSHYHRVTSGDSVTDILTEFWRESE